VQGSHDIVIREARPEDAERLAELVAELGYPTPAPLILRRLAALPETGGRALVAVRGGRIVGLATMQQTRYLHRPNDARLTSLVVASSERGGGIGRRLVEEVERRGAADGCARLELTSGLTRSGAHAFYEHLGYETQSRRFVKALGSPPLPRPERAAGPAG
jgi:GNAT superfamily N-acetyltransferase